MSELIPNSQEFAIEMANIVSSCKGDTEGLHIEMDKAMIELLRQLGYGDAMDIYEAQYIWHA